MPNFMWTLLTGLMEYEVTCEAEKISLNHSGADHPYMSNKKPRPVRSAKLIPIQTYLLNLKFKKKKEDTATTRMMQKKEQLGNKT